MKNSKKNVALVVAVALICTTVVVNTIAYLVTNTKKVTNTFTVGNVDIELTETSSEDNNGQYKMVPGTTLEKNPQVTVDIDSEDCYLFVKVVEANNTANSNVKFVIWEMASDWTRYGDTDVYYKEIIGADNKNVAHSVLLNDEVLVNSNLVKSDMDSLLATDASLPTLTIKTCAVQKDNLGLKDAYEKIPTDF